jgi:hypothetical protein
MVRRRRESRLHRRVVPAQFPRLAARRVGGAANVAPAKASRGLLVVE